MGITKTEKFTSKQNELALLFKALGHPARIAIIEFLIEQESCICGEIVNVLTLAQPTVSQHLKELKNVGLIKGTIEGTSICYCLDKEKFEQIVMYLNAFKNSKNVQTNNCCK